MRILKRALFVLVLLTTAGCVDEPECDPSRMRVSAEWEQSGAYEAVRSRVQAGTEKWEGPYLHDDRLPFRHAGPDARFHGDYYLDRVVYMLGVGTQQLQLSTHWPGSEKRVADGHYTLRAIGGSAEDAERFLQNVTTLDAVGRAQVTAVWPSTPRWEGPLPLRLVDLWNSREGALAPDDYGRFPDGWIFMFVAGVYTKLVDLRSDGGISLDARVYSNDHILVGRTGEPVENVTRSIQLLSARIGVPAPAVNDVLVNSHCTAPRFSVW